MKTNMHDNRTILQGDALGKLSEIEDNSIDLIATDPPYGYSFMNKDWDKAVVSVDIWKECLRVLKPGAFAYVMSAPRQDVLSHMTVNLSDAGFNVNYTSMYWAYASGFPKAMNISKAVDKKLGVTPTKISSSQNEFCFENLGNAGYKENFDITKPASEQAKALDGSYAGYQPKPAVEVILVAMKPLSEKNYVEQAMSNGKGISWFDDVRIPFTNESDIKSATYGGYDGDHIDHTDAAFLRVGMKGSKNIQANQKGRFPANLLVSDGALDTGNISNNSRPNQTGKKTGCDSFAGRGIRNDPNDTGDFSRYYSLDSWEAQFIVTPKPSKSEKNKGLDSFLGRTVNDGRATEIDNPYQRGETVRQNVHPTVKPISLFKYLITMGSRPNDTVLDPFLGSGTTAIAAELTARNWIGIELNPEYEQIIRKRIASLNNSRLDEYISS